MLSVENPIKPISNYTVDFKHQSTKFKLTLYTTRVKMCCCGQDFCHRLYHRQINQYYRCKRMCYSVPGGLICFDRKVSCNFSDYNINFLQLFNYLNSSSLARFTRFKSFTNEKYDVLLPKLFMDAICLCVFFTALSKIYFYNPWNKWRGSSDGIHK